MSTLCLQWTITYQFNLSFKDSFTDDLLQVVDQEFVLDILFGDEKHVVAAHRHLLSGVQADLGPVADLHGLVPHQHLNVAHSVAQTLQTLPSQELHVGVHHNLTAAFLVDVVDVVGHPVRVVHVQVVHVRVQVHVFSEVGDFVIFSQCVTDSFTPVNNDDVVVGDLDAVVVLDEGVHASLSHLDHHGLVDDVAVNEEVGVDFVGSGENDAKAVGSVETGAGQGVDEHAPVDAFSQPACGPDEHVEVLREVQQTEDPDGFVQVFFVGVNEHLAAGQHTNSVHFDELLDNVDFL